MVCLAFAAYAADVSLNVTVSRPQIFLGESVNLNVEVRGADRGLPPPDLSSLPKSEVHLLGSHSNTRSSISVVNGRVTRESFEGRVFAYQVKPAAAGAFKTGAVRMTVAGKTYVHPGVTVEVLGVEQQDTVIAKVTASSTSVLVDEPFTVTLSVAVAELPEPYAEKNEPIHPEKPPQVTADFLELRQAPDASLKRPDLEQILNGLVDQTGRQPSFTLNNYRSRGGFGGFFGMDPFQEQPIRFKFPAERKEIDGKPYREYTLTLLYTPSKEGDYTFGPLTFKGDVIADVVNRNPVMKSVYTIGPAVTVRVVPPPDEGRPEWFIGPVGRNIEVTAAFDTMVCKVGDPLTLTIGVSGEISIANMRAPVLGLQPALLKDFRVYDDSVKADTLHNGKRFSYRVRPLHEGTFEFPPVKMAYYNTEARAYETILTPPIPIQVRATTQIATAGENGVAQIEDAADDAVSPSGITCVPLSETDDTLFPSLMVSMALLLTGPLLCLAVVLARPLRRLFGAMLEHGRMSGALGRARHALRHAGSSAAAALAVRVYLAERLGLASGTALTPGDAYALLIRHGVPAEHAEAARAHLARLDEAMYRPDVQLPLAELARTLCGTLAQIDGALRKPKPNAVVPVILLSLALPWTASADMVTRQFLWEQANMQAAAAEKPEDYAKAAATYERLVADGVVNASVFVNLGAVYVLSGDSVKAAAAFERAERYRGRSPETQQGLLAVAAKQTGRAQAELPWFRTAFFWHFSLPCNARVLAMLSAWALFWAGLFFKLVRRGRRHGAAQSLSEAGMLIGGLMALVFAASVLVTVWQEFLRL